MPVLTYRGTLGAVCAQIEGMIKGRFLPDPDTVIDLRINATPNGTVSANRANGLSAVPTGGNPSLRLSNHGRRQCCGSSSTPHS